MIRNGNRILPRAAMHLFKILSWWLAGLALCVGVVRAILLRWVCDDAFISFRYAQNLIDGHGLVYNAGERVEGYTNFLWLMWTAAGMALGADPIVLCQVLGIGCFVATIALLWTFAARTAALPIAD